MKDETKDPWVVINYEIEMFLGTQILHKIKIQSKVQDKILEGFVRNALTESRILHIRILTEVFLLNTKKDLKKDDIKVDNLLPKWREENIVVYKELEDAYIQPLDIGESPKVYIDKLLAHATTKRGGRFNWTSVVARMNPPLIKVLKTLPTDKCPGLMFLNYV